MLLKALLLVMRVQLGVVGSTIYLGHLLHAVGVEDTTCGVKGTKPGEGSC